MYLKKVSLIILCVSMSFIACVKYKDYPYLEFQVGEGYISSSQNMSPSQDFKIGIIATKNNEPLKNTVVTVIYGTDTLRNTLYTKILTGDSVNRYTGEYNFTTQSKQGIEKYTFSIESATGIITSRTITIHVVE